VRRARAKDYALTGHSYLAKQPLSQSVDLLVELSEAHAQIVDLERDVVRYLCSRFA
jgi:hypothetical protein